MLPFDRITKPIIDQVLPMLSQSSTTIFLIGSGDKNPCTIRNQLCHEFNKFINIMIYYPENLFSDLFYGSKFDLLSLENILAESVDHVILCVESPGSLTELGAFVNHEKLRSRLIVINDLNKKRDRSFINHGPIKLMNSQYKGSILWSDFNNPDFTELAHRIRKRMKNIGKNKNILSSLANPIIAEQFVLISIYCLGSATKKEIDNLVVSYGWENYDKYLMMCHASLNTLFDQRLIYYSDKQYKLSPDGVSRLLSLLSNNYLQVMNVLDKLRIEVLQYKLRKKRKKVAWDRVS